MILQGQAKKYFTFFLPTEKKPMIKPNIQKITAYQ